MRMNRWGGGERTGEAQWYDDQIREVNSGVTITENERKHTHSSPNPRKLLNNICGLVYSVSRAFFSRSMKKCACRANVSQNRAKLHSRKRVYDRCQVESAGSFRMLAQFHSASIYRYTLCIHIY